MQAVVAQAVMGYKAVQSPFCSVVIEQIILLIGLRYGSLQVMHYKVEATIHQVIPFRAN